MNGYFSHDSNARNSERLLAVRMKWGAEGYGVYFMILERLREESQYMSIKDYNIIAFDFRVGADKVKSIIEDFGLFSFADDGKRFYSESFSARMQQKDMKSEKARESASRRWKRDGEDSDVMQTQCECNTNALRTHCERNAIKVKESKVKESKEYLSPLSPCGDTSPLESVPGIPDNPPSEPPAKKEKSSAKKERTVFIPPSVEMVTSYCKENGYTVSAWKFVNYYTSNGWLVGKNRMKDWKAAVRTWQTKENENGNRQLPDCNQSPSGRPENGSRRADAENKRAELNDLKHLAGAVLRGTVPKNGG